MKFHKLNEKTIINLDQICSIQYLTGAEAGASFAKKDEIYVVIALANGTKYRLLNGSEEELNFSLSILAYV
jgi:hypothetical protein